MEANRTLIVVDDETGVLDAYRHYLGQGPPPKVFRSSRRKSTGEHRLPGTPPASYRLLLADTGERAVELVQSEMERGQRIAGGFFDMKMPGGIDGLETIRRLRALDPHILCTIVTAYPDRSIDEINECFSPGHEDEWDYLNKPFTEAEIKQKARNLVASWLRRRREEQRRGDLESLIGHLCRIRGFVDHGFYDYMGHVLEQLVAFTGSRGGFLATVDDDLRFRVGAGLTATERDAQRVLGRSGLREIIGAAREDGQIERAGDLCVVPVVCVKEQRVVVLLDAEHVDEDRRRLVRVFAQNAATAIDNNELYQELKGLNVELESRVEERTRELELARRQLVQKEKLAAVGQLAATVAHEINNPCSYVLASLEEARDELRAERITPVRMAEASQRIDEAIDGTRRVVGIVRDLKRFSRPGEDNFAPVRVEPLLEQAMRILGKSLEHQVRVVRQYAETRPVLGNEDRLVQVFVNVLMNAAQAVDGVDDRDRVITISTEPGLSRARVVVEDTGAGMSRDTLEHLFDPFYSTKGRKGGSGLGLAVTQSIIHQHGGDIEVDSEKGRGTRFEIELPLATDRDVTRAVQDRVSSRAPANPRRLRVLFVEDEELLLSAYKRRFGKRHDLALCVDALSALDLLLEGEHWDVIACDLMMPDLSGAQLYEKVILERPELAHRFIFVTGGAFTKETQRFLADTDVEAVEKPVDLRVLEKIMQRIAAAADRRPGH